jgi:cyclic beta-1,2-glucan synthetase
MQRAGIESILGLRLQGEFLKLNPCIPKGWPRFEITLRYRSATYEVLVENRDGVGRGVRFAEFDQVEITQRPFSIPLLDDGVTHHIRVRLG